jgi:hypothetical protein
MPYIFHVKIKQILIRFILFFFLFLSFLYRMNKFTSVISKSIRDPLKYIVVPIIFYIYSSGLVLYRYLIQPWMVQIAIQKCSTVTDIMMLK